MLKFNEIYMNLPRLSYIYYPLNLTKCQNYPVFAGSLKNGVSSLLNSCCFAFHHQEETPEAPSIGMSEGWGVGG